MTIPSERQSAAMVRKHSRKSEQILAIATKLFSKHGIHCVGMDLISKESDVAGQTVYRNFGGKDDLVKEVLERRHSDVIADITETIHSVEGVDARIKAIFDWHEAWFKTNDFAGCLFELAIAEFAATDSAVSGVAVRHKKTLLEMIDDTLRAELPRKDAKDLAYVILMLLDGATASARAFNDSGSARRAWRVAATLLAQARRKAN